jgi:hypothetical protein
MYQRRPITTLIVATAAVVLVTTHSGCQTMPPPQPAQPDPDAPDAGDMQGGDAVLFEDEVQKIFNARCATCHSVGGFADVRGIRALLTTGDSYDLIVNQPSVQDPDLTIVVPGDSANSLLFEKISSDAPTVGARMPLGGPEMPAAEIEVIRRWIDEGALDN